MKTPIKLPLHCTAEYVEAFVSSEKAKNLYAELISVYDIASQKIPFLSEEDTAQNNTGKIMFMDEHLYKKNAFPEFIWGKTAVWSTALIAIKKKVETYTGLSFSVCVCIFYPDGTSGVAYHSDHAAFGDTTVIPSISIGEERNFLLREKETMKVYDILLKEGSMLIMGEHCQERYEHSLPTNVQYTKGRINLTFRQYGFNENSLPHNS